MRGIDLRLMHKRVPITIGDYRDLARRRLPDIAWSYLEGGAEDCITLANNEAAFRRRTLRQRILTGHHQPSLSTEFGGEPVALPVGLAPTALSGFFRGEGEPSVAAAADRAGARYVLSTGSSYSIEEVARASATPQWFQLYPWANKDRVANLIDRARAAGYSALVVTVDVPIQGNREDERREGMAVPLKVDVRRALHMMRHTAWLADTLRRRRFFPVHLEDGGRPADPHVPKSIAGVGARLAEAASEQDRVMQATLDWDDLAWLRDYWRGRLYVKGVLDPDDAARLADMTGIDGIIVSNHGGRQLDRSAATLDALAAISARVGDRVELYLDGGVRRGSDVVTALCHGARGVFIGRPYIYGLVADGQRGVEDVLEIFRTEIARCLTLAGCPDIRLLDRSWLVGDTPPAAGTMAAAGEGVIG